MTECYGGVLFRKLFEGEGCHSGGGAEFEFKGWIVTEFEVVEVEASFMAASKDGNYARGGGFGEEGEEIVNCAETSVII